jgi:hypothetical protein
MLQTAVQEAKIATEIRKIESTWSTIDLVLEPCKATSPASLSKHFLTHSGIQLYSNRH